MSNRAPKNELKDERAASYRRLLARLILAEIDAEKIPKNKKESGSKSLK